MKAANEKFLIKKSFLLSETVRLCRTIFHIRIIFFADGYDTSSVALAPVFYGVRL
jgi:hypothetical protein